jgi:hypothetical protein
MTKDEALQEALVALDGGHIDRAYGYIQDLLEQPEQEPLEYWNAVEGWVKIDEVRKHFDSVGCGTIYKTAGEDRVPLYTSPQRQPLTDEQILELNTFQRGGLTCIHVEVDEGLIDLARVIEAAHGIGKKT